MKIGLTGSIACGKSTVSAYLRSLGCTVVDADAISHELTAAGGKALPAIRDLFGGAVFHPDGTLDRKALGCLVFSSAEKRAQLNALLHPMIIGEVFAQLDAADSPDALVFGDVPLLYECDMASGFDAVWVVAASREAQIDRLLLRDGLCREEAERRIDAQMPLSLKIQRADAVIMSEGPIEHTQEQVRLLLQRFSSRRLP